MLRDSTEIRELLRLLGKYVVFTDFFARYKLSEVIGGGCFGKVYKTKRLSDGKYVAVRLYSYKELYQSMSSDSRLARECIKNEIKTLRKVSNKSVDSIVDLHGVYEQKGQVMIVME